jgi:hypothetical protein
MIGRLTKRVDMLEVKYSGLKAKHHIACHTIVNHIEEVEEKEKKKEKSERDKVESIDKALVFLFKES